VLCNTFTFYIPRFYFISILLLGGTYTPRMAHSAGWGRRISFVWASWYAGAIARRFVGSVAGDLRERESRECAQDETLLIVGYRDQEGEARVSSWGEMYTTERKLIASASFSLYSD
jgi:hypothetical protein